MTKRVMATKKSKEPSTGSTIYATQVLDLSDEDAAKLLKDGSVADY